MTARSDALVLDGRSEHGAHMRSEMGISSPAKVFLQQSPNLNNLLLQDQFHSTRAHLFLSYRLVY